jgi:hypothetical protein
VVNEGRGLVADDGDRKRVHLSHSVQAMRRILKSNERLREKYGLFNS